MGWGWGGGWGWLGGWGGGGGGGGGGSKDFIQENFWRGVAAQVFDRIPLAKEILVEDISLAKDNFLIMRPCLHDFKEFQPKYSLLKRKFPKTDTNLAQKCSRLFGAKTLSE